MGFINAIITGFVVRPMENVPGDIGDVLHIYTFKGNKDERDERDVHEITTLFYNNLRFMSFTIFSPLNTDLLTPDCVRSNLFAKDVAVSPSSRTAQKQNTLLGFISLLYLPGEYISPGSMPKISPTNSPKAIRITSGL